VRTRTVTFPNRDAVRFTEEVKREVDAYFREGGRSDKATPAMVAKTVLLLGGSLGLYLLILFGGLGPWPMLGLAVLLGVGVAGVGFAVSHDALHGAYSANPTVNKLLGLSFDLFGANGYMWKITHNVIHHTYTNIHGVDEDLSVSPLLRLSPEAPVKRIHRWQHLYAFAAYSTSTLFWVFVKDYKYFLQKDLGPYENKKHPRGEVLSMLAMKLVYYGWAIVLPLLLLEVPWWQFGIGFLAMHLTAGTILGIVFQLAHVVEGTEHPLPDEQGAMEAAWMVHEMETTSNFARSNRLLSWYVGGLNFQVEHHLFPRVCSVHYPAISRIVEAVALRHGVAYNAQPTFRAAVRSHYVMLRRFGKETLEAARASGTRAATA
jgi:linoleoyl-CoA desaturase